MNVIYLVLILILIVGLFVLFFMRNERYENERRECKMCREWYTDVVASCSIHPDRDICDRELFNIYDNCENKHCAGLIPN